MIEDAVDATPRPRARVQPLRKRQVAAVAVGNAIEFYDFVTYAFFAVQIGRTYFPSDEPGASLLASLATFGAGFLTRPLGAWAIGRMGDRRGRKPAMLLSFALIGVAVIGLPLVPPYASIGVAALVLVVLFRLLQGFALGGEVGPSTAFLMEAAPVHRRGLYISMQAMGADAAVLVAGLVGVGLAHVLSPAELEAWGWRVALGLGAVIVPFGLVLRRTLVETFEPALAPPPRTGGSGHLRVALLGLAMLAAATTSAYALEYMTTYANTTLGLPERVALGATALIGLCGLVCDPLSGWLSDRIGRKPVMLVPWLVLLVAILPAFWLLERERSALVEVMAAEAGKTVDQADPEVSEVVDFARYYAQSARNLAAITAATPVPRRVTLVTPPWNFPVAIPGGSVLAALASGSAVILKPAPATRRA